MSFPCFSSSKCGFIQLGMLFLAFIFFVLAGWTYGRIPKDQHFSVKNSDSSPELMVRYWRQGNIQMTIVPVNLADRSKPVEFDIALNDPYHSLITADWSKTAMLEDKDGNYWHPMLSEPSENGYSITFDVTNSAPVLNLRLVGVDSDFSWIIEE